MSAPIRLRTSEYRVLSRLYARPIAGFYHPDDQNAVKILKAQGRVTCWPGEGSDRGLLLASLVPGRETSPPPRSGDAA